MTMLPIPKHLIDLLHPTGNMNHELEVTGNINCTCGSGSFKIKFVGDDEQFKNAVCHIEICESFYLIINAECSLCKRDYLIFDAHLHGWDGYWGREYWADKGKPAGKILLCRNCNTDMFSMSVQINSQGQEDFISEGHPENKKEDWIEAFEWIRITTHCKECNTTTKDWIDCETM